MAKKLCMGCMKYFEEKYEICPHCGYIEGTKPKESYHLTPGTILSGKYIVGKVIGFGGFGVTYIGFDAALNHRIAIKEYLPGEFATRCEGETTVTIFTNEEKQEQFSDGIVKFVDEAKRLAKFQNVSGVVSVYDSFKENNTAYIIMEYLEGETLKEKLEREGKIDFVESLNYVVPILDALTEIHKEGILHRDISPDNIFITKDKKLKLIDFGAARYATTTHSKSLSVIVKPGYAPMEQYRSRGDQGTWTDVYACAAVLYKMITGVTPEDAMERGEKDTLLPPSKLGIQLPKNKENALMNALNLKIEDRTETTEAFKNELLTEDTVKKRKSTLRKLDIGKWPMWAKVSSGISAAAVFVLVLLMATGVIKFSFKDIKDLFHLGNTQARVPNVIGTTLDEASSILTEKDIIVQVVDKKSSDEIPKDLVLSQSVVDGQIVEKGSVLDLVISAGGEIVYMPDVIGISEEDATHEIEELGLTYIKKTGNSEIAPGYVFDQSIPSGTPLEKGSEVEISVSEGIASYSDDKKTEVPNFKGELWEDARTIASDKKLYVFVSDRKLSDTIPKNEVISQDKAEGSKVSEGTSVGLVISLGIEQTHVPDVQYKLLDDALAILDEAKLKVKVTHEDNDTVAKDHVIRQDIEAHKEVNVYTEITIYVSNGNKKIAIVDPPIETSTEVTTTVDRTTDTENGGDERTTQQSDGEHIEVSDNGDETSTQETEIKEPSTEKSNNSNSETKTTEQKTTEQKTTEKKITEAPKVEEPEEPAPEPDTPEEKTFPHTDYVGKSESTLTAAISDFGGLTVGSVTRKSSSTYTDGTILDTSMSGKSVSYTVCDNSTHTEYRYKTASYVNEQTTTDESPGEGYVQTNKVATGTTYSAWGGWSGWSPNAVARNDTTDVQTTSGRIVGAYVSSISPYQNDTPLSDWGGNYSLVEWYAADSELTLRYGVGHYRTNGPASYWYTPPGWAQQAPYWGGDSRWQWTGTLYSYRTRTATTTYTYYWQKTVWGSWSSWSTNPVSEDSETQVETREVNNY